MFQTTFDRETPGILEASIRWFLAAGSGSGLTIFAPVNTIGGIKLTSAAQVRAVVAVDPQVIHQRAEIAFTFDSSAATTAYTGVMVRYNSANNWVYLRVNHKGTKAAELHEVIAGVDTLLATVANPGTRTTGGLALEVIGNRARVWYETGGPVADRPPDTAVNLAGNYTAHQSWGLYMESNVTTSNMQINKFTAIEMPSVVMPAPYLQLADASSSGLNFTPITVTVTGNSFPYLEWEVTPQDPLDIPESYRDITPSTSSRVLFVRPGYAYSVRARGAYSLYGAGAGNGPWSAYGSVTASGVKVLPASDAMPGPVFPSIIPDYVLERTQTSDASAVISDTGRERTSAPWLRPRNSFKLTFTLLTDENAQILIDFFELMQGQNTAFQWTHPTSGQTFAVRFNKDDYTCEGYDNDVGTIWWKLELDIIEVFLGDSHSLTISLTSDPDILPDGTTTTVATVTPDPWEIDSGDLILWLAADQVSPSLATMSDFDLVETWPDLTGNGRNAVANHTTKPYWLSNQVNGKPVLVFSAHQMLVPMLGVARPFSAYIVHKGGSGEALLQATVSYGSGFYPLGFWSPEPPMVDEGTFARGYFAGAFVNGSSNWLLGQKGTNYAHVTSGTTVASVASDALWKVHEAVDDTSSSTYYINGSSMGTSVTIGTPASLLIGGIPTKYYSGQIAEVIFMSTTDATKRAGIVAYLKGKYGIA